MVVACECDGCVMVLGWCDCGCLMVAWWLLTLSYIWILLYSNIIIFKDKDLLVALTRTEINRRYRKKIKKQTYKPLQGRHAWRRTRKELDLEQYTLKELRWMSYDTAKSEVARLSRGSITSREKYFIWWTHFKPDSIPRAANLVYKEEWIGWNHFLGLDNVYDGHDKKKGRIFVSFLEAVRYLHKFQYNNIRMYKSAVRAGEMDIELPLNPEIKYKDEWIGWPHYLGKSVHARMDVLDKMEKLLLVCSNSLLPGGQIELIICEGGRTAVPKLLEEREELKILKIYVHEVERWENVCRIMDNCGVMKGKNIWLCSNVNEAVYGIGDELMFYVPPNT